MLTKDMKCRHLTQNLIERYEAIQKIGCDVDVPFHVYRIIGDKRISVLGDQVELGFDHDFVSLTEARAAVEWYVQQLGGTVKWPSDSKLTKEKK